MIRRREFIAGFGSAVAWPVAAQAQQDGRIRRIGVLMPFDETDPEVKRRLSAFTQALADLGWTQTRNVRMELRWAGTDANRMRALARELIGLKPDIILTTSTVGTASVQRETQTIPIVFASVGDPVASGIVPRLDHPGGNITGLAILEASLGGKWLELLSEIAPELKRAAIMFNPDTSAMYYVPSFETAARARKVVPIIKPVHTDVEIEAAINDLGSEPGGGLVVIPEVFLVTHRAPIILTAARYNVPAVYAGLEFVREGGLLYYGADRVDAIRRAATYVDRILRGAKPGDLPVQFPTKFEMAVNLKTAKALGLTVPQSILLRADKIIE
jgi:putative ABC transport system substrate-binding protein